MAEPTAPAEFSVRGSVNQVAVTGAAPDTELVLYDGDGQRLDDGTTDAQGALLFREVPSGHGVRVQESSADPAPTSDAVEVTTPRSSTPPESFYDAQDLVPGYGYITTRDGTTLSAAIYLPGPVEEGPYPTVVEYSGYSPSNPTNSLEDDVSRLLPEIDTAELCQDLTFVCDTPDQPASTLAAAMGYAVVAVNMRGTGCSGGAYDFFETLQLLDGYDVIETVAAQDWVKGGKVGMVGLSYPGVSQLFVASTQPPHLAAITPLSVYDDTVRGVLAPGGIFNSGFALAWADEVLESAQPYGQEWSRTIAEAGDFTCAANQEMRLQNVDAVAKAQSYEYYAPEVADPLNTGTLASDIEVPTFLACAFEDEQTGGRCARIADKFTGAPVAKFTFYNGAHSDGFAPQVLVEWDSFLDMYLADEITPINPLIKTFAPELLSEVFGTGVPFPDQRWTGMNADEAREAYEAEDSVRIIFENGAGDVPGAPVGRYEARYPSWPIPDTTATSWYLGPDGTLGDEAPSADEGAVEFDFDAALAEKVTLPGDDVDTAFEALPPYQWAHDEPGDAAVFVSEAFTRETTMVGTANADLWVRTEVDDVPLSVTLSEVRADGDETYVQSGW
ncbi:MAG TPA: CocE/NonD family hydrolase, partial [Microthrixaceae bacterium]|nr:CocE/NonD family hydrolase [Microthrixaceae bacterium]